MPEINGKAAWAKLQTFDPLEHLGACLYYNWLAYKAVGATSATVYSTAYSAAMATDPKLRHTDKNPPPGAAIWLGKRLSDGNMDGDVFIAGPSASKHAATDQPTWGKVGLTSIAGRMALTGREFLFWSEDFLGNRVVPADWNDNNEGSDMKITDVYVPVKRKTPQQFSTSAYLRINDVGAGAVSFAQGPGDLFWGNLSVRFEDVKVPTSADASIRVTPVVDIITPGKKTKSVALGTVEILFSSGVHQGLVPVPPIELKDHNHRVRFKVAVTNGGVVKLTEAFYRGARVTS